MRIDERRGFTLLELMLALSLAGFAIVGGMWLLDQVSTVSMRVEREARRHASDANGARLLKQLVLDASAPEDTSGALRGDSLDFSLTTRCMASSGWSEPCRVAVMIDRQTDSSAVIARLSNAESYSTLRIAGRASLRYIDHTSTEATWFKQWSSSVDLPSGVVVVGERDTVVFAVGVVRD